MQQSFDYKGYTLVQELTENYHYMIFYKGTLKMHAACTKKIETQEEAEQHIDSYISISERLFENDQ
jgi:hypothetical protein